MIKLLITDLDDTLYSWIGFFVPAFYDMVDEISKITSINSEVLLAEYKQVHQYCGSSEYPYATLLLPCLKSKYESEKVLREILDPAFHRFNSTRKKYLELYPTVFDTLKLLHEKGIKIIGYTESTIENGLYRLKKLGIDDFFDKMYVSKSNYSQDIPQEISSKITIVSSKKPDSKVLCQICQDANVLNQEAIYVGDSLTKDIYMAKKAGIISVLCKFQKLSSDLYSRLVEISHWTKSDFELEANLKKEMIDLNIEADFIINSYSELIPIIMEHDKISPH